MTSTEQQRIECEARFWIAEAHKQHKGWRYWLKQKLIRIEEVRKHPQAELREAINREVARRESRGS